jgi:UDP-N-acetylmuramoyl-L-alanyl-D-glutamate--2,6-diaminopimelate ligase
MKKLLKKLIPELSPIRLGWHKSKAFVAAFIYGFPARNLTVIGITGTDGKTTTTGMAAHILHENGMAVAALSTAFFRIKENIEWNSTQKTSPSPFTVQKFIKNAKNAGCTHVVLESSSHGLVQGRLDWTFPSVAAITNISEEHLDYHGTMQEYVRAKSLLFRKLKGSGTKVINADDRSFTVLKEIPTKWTIMTSVREPFPKTQNEIECGLWIENTDIRTNGSSAMILSNTGESSPLSLQIPGAFNLANALTAIGCAQACGVALEAASATLASFKGIAGRLEPIDAGQQFNVYIDFTVTPQSYLATLTTLKSMLKPDKRLLVLAGSCGDRMKEKRPDIGRIIASLADGFVITNEDPYTEDPEKIIDEVLRGIPHERTVLLEPQLDEKMSDQFCVRMSDRMRAIKFLLRQAKEGDIVLFCGKGSDTTMMTKSGQIEWNERKIVEEELKNL